MIEGLVSGLLVLGVVGFGAIAAMFMMAGNLIYICEPNEVLVFSGRYHKGEKGTRGYRTIKGGRAFRIPLIEKVDRVDLTNMIIDVQVANAYSLGGIPLTVQGVANIKIAGHDPLLGYALERLLGKRREETARIAKEVLEGNLRGVLSRLTPEQVNDDKLAFAEQLLEEAEHDLSNLGLVLDTMKIQNVEDDRGYLDSIGRKTSAELIKRARIAEANAKSLAIVQDASNRQRARLREITSETAIARAQADRRVRDAQTRGTAMVAEQVGQVESEIARTEAAIEAAEATVEQTRRRLDADVIEPASANMEAGIAEAKGDAARIIEDGRATVQVLEEMIAVWKEAGDNARDIFLMQKLNAIMGHMADTVGAIKVDKLTMLPEDKGGGANTARNAVRLVEELKGALGVDLPKLLEDYAGSSKASE
jgi:flotillin